MGLKKFWFPKNLVSQNFGLKKFEFQKIAVKEIGVQKNWDPKNMWS